ncbi:hypothetical protein [Brevundimonas fluminis]|jgi:hypothetical protein|uniref:hypothetical protein n=1 Tax=Brevundimonas fluminis TaxID=2487274 RepID=UPI000F6569A2|nr:hypothetical protein [Brevundimonas fluminis]
MRSIIMSAVATLMLAGCDATQDGPVKDKTPPERPATGPLTPTGPAQTLSADADPNLQQAAAVVELTPVEGQGALTVKMFGTAGGDPAMNGLYTYVAFFIDPAEGWRVFRIGDFLDYRVLSAGPGRVELEIDESTMDPETSEIGSTTRRLIVGWAPGADGAAPVAVTVTPAR